MASRVRAVVCKGAMKIVLGASEPLVDEAVSHEGAREHNLRGGGLNSFGPVANHGLVEEKPVSGTWASACRKWFLPFTPGPCP